MAEQPLKVGMIGVSGFGGARRSSMRRTGLFDLVACYDRNPDAMAGAQKQDGAKPCESLEELLAVDGLEAMVISTGADSHAALSIAAMEAGLHVFVEKPLCTSVDECRQLREIAQRTGRVVGVGHTHHAGDAASLTYQKLVDAGQLGTVAAYEENTSHSGGLIIKPGDWRGKADRNPGGMLFQCGVHAFHRLVHLFGPVEAVSAMMRYDVHSGTETADVATVLVRHASGMVGTLNTYHITGYVHELRIFGTRGNVYFDTHASTALYQERKGGEVEPREPYEMVQPDRPAHDFGLVSWFNGIRTGSDVTPSLECGIGAVVPVFAATRAANEKREVAVSELMPQAV